jgi:hypothetical protein
VLYGIKRLNAVFLQMFCSFSSAPMHTCCAVQVSVHVTQECSGCLDFVHKNFSFKNMTLKELIQAVQQARGGTVGSCTTEQAAEGGASALTASTGPAPAEPSGSHQNSPTKFYLRSVGVNPRKEPSHLHASFPDLAQDIKLPEVLLPPGMPLFSSVLRMGSPGLRLWTHYDVMDNLLLQIRVR